MGVDYYLSIGYGFKYDLKDASDEIYELFNEYELEPIHEKYVLYKSIGDDIGYEKLVAFSMSKIEKKCKPFPENVKNEIEKKLNIKLEIKLYVIGYQD